MGPMGVTGDRGPTAERITFPPALHFKEVPLPLELANEPFTYNDNGKRVSRTSHVKRELFSFEITTNDGAVCKIGGKIVSRTLVPAYIHAPPKSKSQLSVISVYDVYGLEVTYAFLKRLYLLNHPNWTIPYLQASLTVLERPRSAAAVLQPDAKHSGSAVRPAEHAISVLDGDKGWICLASTLLFHLAMLELQQPRLTAPLTQIDVQLPYELIARITHNPALSSCVANALRD